MTTVHFLRFPISAPCSPPAGTHQNVGSGPVAQPQCLTHPMTLNFHTMSWSLQCPILLPREMFQDDARVASQSQPGLCPGARMPWWDGRGRGEALVPQVGPDVAGCWRAVAPADPRCGRAWTPRPSRAPPALGLRWARVAFPAVRAAEQPPRPEPRLWLQVLWQNHSRRKLPVPIPASRDGEGSVASPGYVRGLEIQSYFYDT